MTTFDSTCSRFQVLSEGEPAWAQHRGRSYFFDGLQFWTLGRNGKRRLIVSWQAPSYGWSTSGGGALAC